MDATSSSSPNDRVDQAEVVGLRRAVNDEIFKIAATFPTTDIDSFEFLCECGDLNCPATVRLTLSAYAESPAGSVVSHG